MSPPSHDEERLDTAHPDMPVRYRTIENLIEEDASVLELVQRELEAASLLLARPDEPCSFAKAERDEARHAAMQEEMYMVNSNRTWELVDLLHSNNPIGLKWVYKLKKNDAGVIERLEETFEIQSTFDDYEVDQSVKPLIPDPRDFAPHVKPYARFYIETKLKMSMVLALPDQQVYNGNISSSTWDMRHAQDYNPTPNASLGLLIFSTKDRRKKTLQYNSEELRLCTCIVKFARAQSASSSYGRTIADSHVVAVAAAALEILQADYGNSNSDYWAILQQKDSTWQIFGKVGH
ncbi:hypothetical protein E2562_036348 [Oryza meyeriana var. granulata]|uniref:Reverse transcriptase Ty1/copia-type domain-containing protein n=1 Tax=Oryza meyeriana var. granulata TaxID=110450 RepID=A0A6G1CB70_9ORYZ|nr:hypothetical protein E2562_036348 [Oryza meyeriana var. granulata]